MKSQTPGIAVFVHAPMAFPQRFEFSGNDDMMQNCRYVSSLEIHANWLRRVEADCGGHVLD